MCVFGALLGRQHIVRVGLNTEAQGRELAVKRFVNSQLFSEGIELEHQRFVGIFQDVVLVFFERGFNAREKGDVLVNEQIDENAENILDGGVIGQGALVGAAYQPFNHALIADKIKPALVKIEAQRAGRAVLVALLQDKKRA